MVRCGSKNRHQKDILCFEEIRQCPLSVTILGLRVNVIVGTLPGCFTAPAILASKNLGSKKGDLKIP